MLACVPDLSPETYRPHPLHEPDRTWPETNCVLDLWIELLHALNLSSEPLLSVAAQQDFEGDQFGFTKLSYDDLEFLYGMRVQELSLYEPLEEHVARQISRGRLCFVAADAYYLPDTGQASYRRLHRTTTIGINRLDREKREIEYFHNGGYFRLAAPDYQSVFETSADDNAGRQPLVEYTSLCPNQLGVAECKSRGKLLLAKHWERRPHLNPIKLFQAVLPEQAEALLDRGPEALHDYSFHTFRMLGSNFDLLGSCLNWLSASSHPLSTHCATIAESAASMPLHLAHALARRRFDRLSSRLNAAADAWDQLFESIVVLAA